MFTKRDTGAYTAQKQLGIRRGIAFCFLGGAWLSKTAVDKPTECFEDCSFWLWKINWHFLISLATPIFIASDAPLASPSTQIKARSCNPVPHITTQRPPPPLPPRLFHHLLQSEQADVCFDVLVANTHATSSSSPSCMRQRSKFTGGLCPQS